MIEPLYFGIRHLSPAGAFHLRGFLDEKQPRLVLVEGPEDFTGQLEDLVRQDTKPPVAMMAYTREEPVRTLLCPFASYSPEYQAALWCHENGARCRFMDLPSEVFLALESRGASDKQGSEIRVNVYQALDKQAGEDGHETFWERTLEHAALPEAYRQGAEVFGRNLRELTQNREEDWAEILVRESYMSRNIISAVESGLEPEQIAVVTGAYHVEGLRRAVRRALERQGSKAEALSENGESKANIGPAIKMPSGSGALADAGPEETGASEDGICAPEAMTDQEVALLPRAPASHTLMPYSFYRLSSRSGYGAGNKAPAYYELLWEALKAGEPFRASYSYLSHIAGFQREQGSHVSSAQVIEAVRLASSLADLRAGASFSVPALRDLRDAAVTCMGDGSLAAISLAVADTEIGACIGSLPEGVSRTSVQEDFYRCLKSLKLEKYRDVAARDLSLDLRENRSVKTEKSAFLDLSRSFFLHRLRVLGVSFARRQQASQDNATWAEHWVLRWTPEAEIELVESALKGDTIPQAASFAMKERVEQAGGMEEIARVIEDAFTCGMPAALDYAARALQAMAVDAVSLDQLAATAASLSTALQYGGIRRMDPAPLMPILEQIFYRACLILPAACICDDGGGKVMGEAMGRLNDCALAHDFLNQEAWLSALKEVARRDDLNTRLSGLAAAVLLERGEMDTAQLHTEVQRRLSKGVPAELGAGWFEGLAMKNRYALIARLPLWESLDSYLDTLDDEEFKRALVFLRRAFADFTSMEKDEIAENMGEIWGLGGQQVSEAVNAPLLKEAGSPTAQDAMALGESLEDFDFDI